MRKNPWEIVLKGRFNAETARNCKNGIALMRNIVRHLDKYKDFSYN